MQLEELVARLAEPKQTAVGYDARCPAHPDSHASLSVAEGKKGLVVKCHANCTTKAVVAALGLEMKDLFYAPANGAPATGTSPRVSGSAVTAPAQAVGAGAASAIGAAVRSPSPRAAEKLGRIVAEYDYLDASGARLYQVVRFDPKGFRPRRAPQAGEPSKNNWVWSLKGVPLVLYRLPDVLRAAAAHQRIYVVEGEKDADNLVHLGVVATSAQGGASKKWLPEYSESLRGACEVVVIPDKDTPGQQYASKVLAALNVAGIPARSLILPGDGKDASDWIAAGGSAQALSTLAGSPPAPGGSHAPGRPTLRTAIPGDPPGPAPLRDLGKNLESACRLMRDDVARGLALWPGPIGYNLMSEQVECGGRSIEDHHLTQIREQVAAAYSMPGGGTPLRLTDEQVSKAIELVAHEREFHPVEVWLKGLPFSGAGHIERIAREGLGLTNAREIDLVRKWFISAVARPLRPGCQVDTALILVGGQGVGKTSFFRALAGSWYNSGPVKPDDNNSLSRLHRSWIYEWAELAGMNRRRQDEVRDFMSTTVDTWRGAYKHFDVRRPRRFVLAGSTNIMDFLCDATGNRRSWPAHVGAVDVGLVTELREAAFAEARDALLAGEHWWLSREEEAAQAKATAAFEEVDVWQEPIEEWLERQAGLSRNCFTALDLLRFAVKCNTDKVTSTDARRVADVMRHVKGWTTGRCRADGVLGSYWHPDSDSIELHRLPRDYHPVDDDPKAVATDRRTENDF